MMRPRGKRVQPNLNSKFMQQIFKLYKGTRLDPRRQEKKSK